VRVKGNTMLALAGLLFAGLFTNASNAQVDVGGVTESAALELICPDASVFSNRMVSSVCWECLFPIRIAGADMGSQGNKAPSRAAGGFCYCPGCGFYGRFGVTVGYWSPSRIWESTQPYCFPSLGGITMSDLSPFASMLTRGTQGARPTGADRGDKPGFSQFHVYSYPIVALLGIIDQYDCVDDGVSEFDILFMGEMFPNWANDELSAYLNPESSLFGNPAGALAQPIDCLSATITYAPIDSLFWVAGCWGSHFPLTGHTDGKMASPIQSASLRLSRSFFMLHRIGLTKRQGGWDAVCKPQIEPIMSKSFYRAQQFWPMPESGAAFSFPSGDGSLDDPISMGPMQPTCCHALGANTLTWGEWRSGGPMIQDQVHLVWRWVDCCVGVCI